MRQLQQPQSPPALPSYPPCPAAFACNITFYLKVICHELGHASGTAAALTRQEDLYFHLLLPSLIAEHTQHMLGHLRLAIGATAAAADGQLNKRPGKKGASHWCEDLGPQQPGLLCCVASRWGADAPLVMTKYNTLCQPYSSSRCWVSTWQHSMQPNTFW
jgi:hypothetical protein